MPRILYVEDETEIQDAQTRLLEARGFEVITATGHTSALDQLRRGRPDIVLLDVMLNEGPEPHLSGFDILSSMRAEGYDGAVIFLTARSSDEDKITGLGLGADDYVTKPFNNEELQIRIQNVLRRTGVMPSQRVYRYGEVVVDLDQCTVFHPDDQEKLSKREGELLGFLINNRGKVLERAKLLTEIWKYSPNVTTRTVDTHILNVRKKLRDDATNPTFIETFHGIGYRFIGKEQ